MLMKGDFHIHSTASDGLLSPEEIIVAAKSRGVNILSITDHNTTNGIKEASNACKKYGISVVPGVELSTRHGNESIHLLGYFRNTEYLKDTFQYALEAAKAHQAQKIRDIFKNCMDITSSSRYLSVSEGITLLKLFGASVVLAHPVRINKKNLTEILNNELDGIEAKYCHSNQDETAYFIDLALSKFSFYTGGSDFHTNKINDFKHSIIGEPCLNAIEIQRFLRESGALLLN